MTDEKPLAIKKLKINPRVTEDVMYCIIHSVKNTSDKQVRPLTEQSFNTIKKCQTVRQSQAEAHSRMNDICGQIPDEYHADTHGQHRWCYQAFTKISRLVVKRSLETNDDDTKVEGRDRRSRKCSSVASTSSGATSHALFPNDQCIFCGKGRRKSRGEMEGLVKCVTESSESTIKKCAKEKNDFELIGKIEGVDLRAREAHYHESCRSNYIRNKDTHTTEVSSENAQKKSAHDTAFRHLCKYIETNVILGCSVVRMSMLKDIYLQYMEENFPTVYNPDYRNQNLKKKLFSEFRDKLEFWRPNYRSELVYSSALKTGEAIEIAFEAASSESRILEDAATILRRTIQHAHHTSPQMPWPPSADFLKSNSITPPQCLKDFLIRIVSGQSSSHCTEKTLRLSNSFAEDISTAATHGKWKLQKHLLLAETMHSFGSSELVTILNRYGHCQSYSSVLELETALANQVQLQDDLLPSNIIPECNKVCNICWDNFDVLEETPSGSGTTHTTHGIIVQEVADNADITPINVSIPKSRERSLKYSPSELPPCFAKKKAEPAITASPDTAQIVFDTNALTGEMAWVICRALYNKSFTVPEWSGWISNTSPMDRDNHKQSIVGYMAPILHPITEYSTVQHCLLTSLEVSKKMIQQFTFVTMDLAAAKIAYDIQWQNPEFFSKMIINLGAFHIMCSYMGSLGKMMTGSGFEDILIEAGLCASGSIDKVMSGKHYNRAMRVHQRMNDAIERLLLDAFIDNVLKLSNDSMPTYPEFVDLAASPSQENLMKVVENEECSLFITKLCQFKSEVRAGKLGHTAKFWLMYSDCVMILLRFQRSVKENNFALYIESIRELCSLLFSADHLHYARYLPVFLLQLENLSLTHPGAEELLTDNGFSVSRSNVPACRNAIDLTIEQTINRSAKTRGGIIGFTRNPSAYYRWCLTRHKRASYVEATLDRADMTSDSTDTHKSNRKSEIRRSDKDVSNLVHTFSQFLNPFKIPEHNNNVLLCLSSGKPASGVVTNDLLKYVEVGKKAVQDFVKNRLVEKTIKFHDTLKKQNLRTFKTMATVTILTTTQKKTIQVKAERNLLGRLLMLSQKNNISLEKLFKYPLVQYPGRCLLQMEDWLKPISLSLCIIWSPKSVHLIILPLKTQRTSLMAMPIFRR